MVWHKIRTGRYSAVSQGDIIRNVDYIEYAEMSGGTVEISTIRFPYVVVLSQSCDLDWDHKRRRGRPRAADNKFILSVLVAPAYNAENFFTGQHLEDLGLDMGRQNSNKKQTIKGNQNERYHHMEFDEEMVGAPPELIVDFKHFFSVNAERLTLQKRDAYVCRIDRLYREGLTQRFAAYLARIGLPG